MKKIITILLSLFVLSTNAQSFYRGALVVDANVGVDLYNVNYHYQLKGTSLSTDKNDKAGSHNFNFGGEFGVLKWLGVGLRFKFDNFYTSRDSVTHTTPTVKGFEGAVVINFHLVRVKHFDLLAGFNVGISHLNYHQNDVANTQLYGSGSGVDFHITPRFYFGRFGLNVNFSVPAVKYNNLTSNNSVYNNYILATWKGTGFGTSIGIQYRFFKG